MYKSCFSQYCKVISLQLIKKRKRKKKSCFSWKDNLSESFSFYHYSRKYYIFKKKIYFPIQTICFIFSNLLLISWKQSTREDFFQADRLLVCCPCRNLNLELTVLQLLAKAWLIESLPPASGPWVPLHSAQHPCPLGSIALVTGGNSRPTGAATKLSWSKDDTHDPPRIPTPKLTGKCIEEQKFEPTSSPHNVFHLWGHVNFRNYWWNHKDTCPISLLSITTSQRGSDFPTVNCQRDGRGRATTRWPES